MKLLIASGAVCGLFISGFAASVANAALVATFTVGDNTATLNGTLDTSGQNYEIAADTVPTVGDFNIYGFSASSNSPSATTSGQVPLEKAAAAFVATNTGSGYETLTINLLDNGFTSNTPSSTATLSGAASVTFYSSTSTPSQTLDYFQYAGSVNTVSVNSNMITYNPVADGFLSTKNVAVGPVDCNLSEVYSLGSTLVIGLNSGDSATLTFQTDPSPTALPLPDSSAILGLGLAGMLLLRRCAS